MTRLMARLSLRERWLIALGLPLLLIAAGWIYLWQPLQADRAAISMRIAEARTLQAALDRYPEGSSAGPAAVAGARPPVSSRVTRSAEAAGIVLSRLEPLGTGLTVLVDAAAFDDIIGWIAQMESAEGLRLGGIELARRADPGVVSARLELEDAS